MKLPTYTTIVVDTNSEAIRLSKYLAQKGICSRREADEWINQNWIRINGINSTLGQRIYANQKIEISSIALKKQAKFFTILLNKPIGYVSGQAEDGYSPASILLTAENQYHASVNHDELQYLHKPPKNFPGLAPAGRLDIDSTGLLVFTQDGRIAKYLIGENSQVEKKYLVRVAKEKESNGPIDKNNSNILAKLREGLFLDGVRLKPAKVEWQNHHQLKIILKEGRKRQIRRMCKQVGLKVIALKRVRIGKIRLGALPIGQWRFLQGNEMF